MMDQKWTGNKNGQWELNPQNGWALGPEVDSGNKGNYKSST